MKPIVTELKKLHPRYGLILKDEYAMIRCPFHEGKGEGGLESTPSLRIVLKSGDFRAGFCHCFACNKSVGWNQLAQVLGLTPGEASEDAYVYDVVTENVKTALFGATPSGYDVSTMLPWTDDWRGISGKLLQRVGARTMFSEVVEDIQLYLPCVIHGVQVGGICAVIQPTSRTKRKYINTPGHWAQSSLYPYDYTSLLLARRDLDTTVLVEGPRDALNLLQYGIPAVALIGAGQWSDTKRNLILSLGTNFILAFDPDPAGQHATATVYKAIKGYADVSQFDMEPGEDPGCLSRTRIKELKDCL